MELLKSRRPDAADRERDGRSSGGMETRCAVKARPGKSGGGLRLSPLKPPPDRRAADRRRSSHDHEARAPKMAHHPLRGDGSHVFVGVVDALAALKPQRESDRVLKILPI